MASTENTGQDQGAGTMLEGGNSGEFLILFGDDDSAADSPTEAASEAAAAEPETSEAASPEQRMVDLGKEATIAGVSQLQKSLLPLLETGEPIEVDASQVSAIDTATLQLLCSFVYEAEHKNIELQWQVPSQRFLQTAARVDLLKHLHMETPATH